MYNNNSANKIYIPRTILLAVISGVFTGLVGLIVGAVIGLGMDIHHVFTEVRDNWVSKDEGYW